ncbi:MAG: hypothetical protein IJF73_05440 [Clostridia bacterium]|nr:hypothetical protein [Clostridia bacterium]
MDNKKTLSILTLRLLETATSKRRPMTQVEMAALISSKYPCDRKTVGRNIRFLRDLGYKIIKTPKGFYMDRQLFTHEEVRFVVGTVKAADVPEGSDIDSKDLAERLYDSLTRYYRT